MGGLRLGMEMIRCFFSECTLYISNPSYPPHYGMAKQMGITVGEYRYYN